MQRLSRLGQLRAVDNLHGAQVFQIFRLLETTGDGGDAPAGPRQQGDGDGTDAARSASDDDRPLLWRKAEAFQRQHTEHSREPRRADGHCLSRRQPPGQRDKPIAGNSRFLCPAAEMRFADPAASGDHTIAGSKILMARSDHPAGEIDAGDHRKAPHDWTLASHRQPVLIVYRRMGHGDVDVAVHQIGVLDCLVAGPVAGGVLVDANGFETGQARLRSLHGQIFPLYSAFRKNLPLFGNASLKRTPDATQDVTPRFQTSTQPSKQPRMIWLIFALLTGAAVMAVLAPLAGKNVSVDPAATDKAFFGEQIAEIERERDEGRLDPQDAEAARLEAARRLLRASEAAGGSMAPPTGLSRLVAAGATLLLVPAVAVPLYLHIGSASLPDMPLAERLAKTPPHQDLSGAVAQIETHLAAHPEDGRGFEVVAPYYLRNGRFDEAVHAFTEALRLLGATPTRYDALGEALVLSAQGAVTPAARRNFEAALALDETDAMSRYYLGLGAAQDGDVEKAGQIWTKLLADRRRPQDIAKSFARSSKG